MSTNGPVAIQGCAIRVTRLNADGSFNESATAMVQDDRPLVKLNAKPQMQNGVEITPVSACGIPVVSFKDFDRYKRWDVDLTWGDWDPEAMEMLGQGAIINGTTSAGRTFADGVITTNENLITSPALAAFVATDVGRSVTGTGVGASAFITEVLSATKIRVSALSTSTASAVSITLGATASSTIGYQFPHLLLAGGQNGVSLEVWSKLIVRGTGYQGTTPYPSAGSPTIPGSPYLRTGMFRCFLYHTGIDVENKEQANMMSGWAIENPNFGTGPLDDWRTSGLPAIGVPIDTTAWANQIADFQLPTPLQPGYQMVA